MSQPKITLPVRPRSYRFAMTPLADAMFQLLIFFMLTSSLTPYSLLTVQSAQTPPETASSGASSTTQNTRVAPSDDEIWILEADKVVIRRQVFTFENLDTVIDALGADGSPAAVVLLVDESARVQDVTTVMARLAKAKVASVSLHQGAP